MPIASFFSQRDINVSQLWTLLKVYLKQDFRGANTFLKPGKVDAVASNWAMLLMVAMYLLLGLALASSVLIGIDLFFFEFITCTFTIFIVSLAVVAESGNVIFNDSEGDVMGHLPISSRTLFLAKVINLLLFSMLLAGAANFFPTLAGAYARGSNWLFPVGHILATGLSCLFATFLIIGIYGLLMRFVSKERFDSFIAYCQALLGIVFLVGYQILPRLIEAERLQGASFRPYYAFLPPAWFSSVALVIVGVEGFIWYGMAVLGLAVVAGLSWLALRKVAAGYSLFLINITRSSASRSPKKRDASRTERRSGFITRVLVGRRPVERAVFDLVSTYLKRDREIRVRLFPQLAYFIVLPLVALVTGGLPDPFFSSEGVFVALMGPAMTCFVALAAIEGLVFSDHYRAAYVFYATPIERLGDVHSGIRKSVFVRIVFPGFVILFILYGIVWRSPLHAFFVLAPWFALAPTVLLIPFRFRRLLPLAKKYQKGQQSARTTGVFIASMVAFGFFGVIQFLVMRSSIPYWVLMAGSVGVSAFFYLLLSQVSNESRPVSPGE